MTQVPHRFDTFRPEAAGITSSHSAFDAMTEHVRQLFHVKCALVILESERGVRCISWQGW